MRGFHRDWKGKIGSRQYPNTSNCRFRGGYNAAFAGSEVQCDVQAVWPLLAGVRPNDPILAPPFVDPRETLENENGEGILDDETPMFPSPARPEPAGVEPAASSAGANPPASVPEMEVDLRGDDDEIGFNSRSLYPLLSSKHLE